MLLNVVQSTSVHNYMYSTLANMGGMLENMHALPDMFMLCVFSYYDVIMFYF